MRVSEAVMKMGGLVEKDMELARRIREYEKQSEEGGEEEIPYYRFLTPFYEPGL